MPVDTVYSRSKKNGGFMAGPNHALLNNKMAMAQAPEQSEEESKAPPNLRNASAESAICGTCDHFSGMSCDKFDDYPVKFHEGCDAHSSLTDDEESEGETPEEEEDDEE